MIVIIAIFGLIIGSFLNMVIYRLKSGEKMFLSRSKCPKCHHVLGFGDLVPIFSFILLKGKCHYCRKKISWQYPLVELACTIFFSLGYFKYLSQVYTEAAVINYAVYLIFCCFLTIIFVYDWKYYLILDKVSLPAFFCAFIINYFLGRPALNLLLASLFVGGFFLLQYVLSKGKWIGGGDIRLGLVMGAMLGWPMVLTALFLSYVTGAVFAIILVALKKKQWNSQIPFGTFLALATVVTLLYGEALTSWYLSLGN
jgi:prepilin signal peptidase PulO-like enzyme (type II secretory pathway)